MNVICDMMIPSRNDYIKLYVGRAQKERKKLWHFPLGGGQWAKIMVHSTLNKQIYKNGPIYEENIN